MSDLHLCNCMYEHALVPKGRWVPWCVEHDSLRRDASGDQKAQRCQQAQLIFHWVDRLTPCVWHPQGAFIPDDRTDEAGVEGPSREQWNRELARSTHPHRAGGRR